MNMLSARIIVGSLCGCVGASQGWSIWWTLAFGAVLYVILLITEAVAEHFLRRACSLRVPM